MADATVWDVTASSFYKSDAFGPANLIDGDRAFGGWIAAAGHCKDAWVCFRFTAPVLITSVEICNGFIEKEAAETRDDYYFHKRAKDVTLSFGPNGPAPLDITLDDGKEPQSIDLKIDRPVREARLTIRSTYDTGPDETTQPFDVVGLRHVAWHVAWRVA
jgi:hypothetical protein